jgi:hypothetical protein
MAEPLYERPGVRGGGSWSAWTHLRPPRFAKGQRVVTSMGRVGWVVEVRLEPGLLPIYTLGFPLEQVRLGGQAVTLFEQPIDYVEQALAPYRG